VRFKGNVSLFEDIFNQVSVLAVSIEVKVNEPLNFGAVGLLQL